LTTPEYLTVVTEFLIQHCSRPVVNLQTRVKSLKIGDLITSQVWLLLFLLIGSANKLLVESFVGKIWQLYLTFRFLFINALLVTTSWVSGVFFFGQLRLRKNFCPKLILASVATMRFQAGRGFVRSD